MSNRRKYVIQDVVTFRSTSAPHGGLSNMAPGYPIFVGGIGIRTSEALYQACRFPYNPEVQKIIIDQRSPMTAKMKGRKFLQHTRPDWNDVRVDIMKWCLRVKLIQNWEKFSRVLFDTNSKPIVEDSNKDKYWAAKQITEDELEGINALGRLLMELREEMKIEKITQETTLHPVPIKDFLLFSKPIGLVEYRGNI